MESYLFMFRFFPKSKKALYIQIFDVISEIIDFLVRINAKNPSGHKILGPEKLKIYSKVLALTLCNTFSLFETLAQRQLIPFPACCSVV